MIRLLATLVVLAATAGAAACARTHVLPPTPPATLLGRWIDDYGNTFAITRDTWAQAPHGMYDIVEWLTGDRALIARRGPTPTDARTIWLRIDWMALDQMPPWEWGFCLTAWEAPTREAAQLTKPADRTTPRTGCGGHPFSRMKRDIAAVGREP